MTNFWHVSVAKLSAYGYNENTCKYFILNKNCGNYGPMIRGPNVRAHSEHASIYLE